MNGRPTAAAGKIDVGGSHGPGAVGGTVPIVLATGCGLAFAAAGILVLTVRDGFAFGLSALGIVAAARRGLASVERLGDRFDALVEGLPLLQALEALLWITHRSEELGLFPEIRHLNADRSCLPSLHGKGSAPAASAHAVTEDGLGAPDRPIGW